MRYGKWAVLLLAAVTLLLSAGSAAAIGDLSGAYNQDGLSFHYPDAWLVSNSGPDVYLGTSESALSALDNPGVPDLADTEFGVIITLIPVDLVGSLDITADSTPLDFMNALLPSIDQQPDFTFGEPFGLTSGPKDLARLDGTAGNADLSVIIVKLEGSFALVGAIAGAGTIGRWDAPLYAIIRSMEYNTPSSGF